MSHSDVQGASKKCLVILRADLQQILALKLVEYLYLHQLTSIWTEDTILTQPQWAKPRWTSESRTESMTVHMIILPCSSHVISWKVSSYSFSTVEDCKLEKNRAYYQIYLIYLISWYCYQITPYSCCRIVITILHLTRLIIIRSYKC